MLTKGACSTGYQDGLFLPVNLAYVSISLFKNNPGLINGSVFTMKQVFDFLQIADILFGISSLPAIGSIGLD
jgi:hypothetical protein